MLLFASISWILARRSLRPMVDVISHLDRFNKDLIHDLNTPITSIVLNTNMLKKTVDSEQLKKIIRIENSAKSLTSLYSGIEILLDEHAIIKSKFNLEPIITNLIENYRIIYPNIRFEFDQKVMNIKSNENSLKRILDNIISNACKYSQTKNALVNIVFKNEILTIKDNGKGIKYPKKVFERAYKESTNGHGIGMHIVHRLCLSLDIDITLESSEHIGTKVILKLQQ
jgi:two-component system OmpR family sensor kinase